MDRVLIPGLKERCILGIRPGERGRKRPVIVDLELECDVLEAARHDELGRTVDYSAMARRVRGVIRDSRFGLVEALAERVAAECLKGAGVVAAVVTVWKPGAIKKAGAPGVRVYRKNQ